MIEKYLLVRACYGINIHSDAHGEYGTVLESPEIYPDISLITAATILNGSPDHEVVIIDAPIEDDLLPDKLIEKIKGTHFDKLILKTAAASVKSDLELIRQIKKIFPDRCVMLAGHAAKSLSEWILKNTDADGVITEPLDEYIYRTVYGREADMDLMPTPDYTLVDYRRYKDNSGNIRLTLKAGRGCPMNCSYCPYIRYYDRFGTRSVDKVIEDMKVLVSLGADIIQFRDQFFTCDKQRTKEICERIIKEGISVRWIIETRITSLDEELIALLSKAGLFLICFGVEAGNKDILDEYNSNKGRPEVLKKTVEYLDRQGILTMAFYIVGFPEDTWETMRETYRFASSINSSIAAFNEYMDFDLPKGSGPEVFSPFENSTNTGRPYHLNRDEVRYAKDLFSGLYTMEHDSLGKAYEYNYLLAKESRQKVSLLKSLEDDLIKMSQVIRETRSGI
ncbi:MAG: radical SAM protein [Clostridiales bacterium]|nr:radical SAM protein [Clostridiales bacterium]